MRPSSKRLYKVILLASVFLLLASTCLADTTPKNIILMIGDGMGIGHITAARCAGPGPDGRLAMDTMPVTGLVLTYSADHLVTDSAAAGTALATGVKTRNHMVSVTPDGAAVHTILELARQMGKSAGLVSTKQITDATPAVFCAHVPSRTQQYDIAGQMLASRVNVILGGGKRYFVPKSVDRDGRDDDRDLLEEARKRGYDVVETTEGMRNSKSNRLLGLFASDLMTTQRPEPTIEEMATKAISTLSSNPSGFFVMIEGGEIDTYAHRNDADETVRQALMFDDAVRAALEFARKDGNTLVLVTADHETGGLAVHDPEDGQSRFKPGWTSNSHSANTVAVYAYGPGSGAFTGTHDNTEIPRLCARLWGRTLN